MEKDYFKDRPYDVIGNPQNIKIGMTVLICEKIMQDIATEITDLTEGEVIQILTKHIHPRGVKVKIKSGGRITVGRITYIVKDGLILTSNGWKLEKDVNK